jgi:toxin ParE1/3/4
VTALLYTDATERDLTRISLRIAADDPRIARRFVERIRDHCAHLARFPDMGRARPDVYPGVRSLAHGSYVIYYQRHEDADEVHVLRIWHGRRLTPAIADLL